MHLEGETVKKDRWVIGKGETIHILMELGDRKAKLVGCLGDIAVFEAVE